MNRVLKDIPEPTVGSRTELEDESHLRSAQKSAGYHIRAVDDEIGHLEDFLMEPDSWRIDSVIIDTSNRTLLMNRQVIL